MCIILKALLLPIGIGHILYIFCQATVDIGR